jgi:hypothetical protein
MSSPITAVIIARNAETTIGPCVRALAFCDRIMVGENNSQDHTVEQARAAGAQVQAVVWQGYGRTKNKLIAQVPAGWILSIDADEIVTSSLAEEIREATAQENGPGAYWIARRNYYLGREIKHGGWGSDWQLRLFRAGLGRFEERRVHEALQAPGRQGRLKQAMEHYSYAGLEDYLRRLNHYTGLAASERMERGKDSSGLRLVCDPVWTFLKMYMFKAGWRDGFPGYALSVLSALNTLVKHAKHWELHRARQNREPGRL